MKHKLLHIFFLVLFSVSGFSQDTDGDGITDSFDHFPNDRMYDSYTDVIAAPSGSGTQLDPYLISKLADLYWVTQNDTSWTSYFKQTADIDATNSKLWNGGYGFERIGEGPSNHFKGRYDGNYHTISNIYQLGTYGNQAGMFGAILDGAVRNLKLTAPIIVVTEFTQYGGILAGQVLNSIVKTEATIQNVVIESATITGTSIADNAYYGGMVGISQNALFKDCKATLLDLNLSVSNTNVSVGGFIGTSDQNDKLLNCSVDGILTSDSRFFGGLIGNSSIVSADDYSQILNCYSNVSLYSNNADFVGGLIGVATNVSINNSYSKNTISFNTDEIQIGGFIGNLDYLFNTVPTDFNYITNNYIATTFTGTTTNQSGIGLFLGEDSADSYGANNFYQELAGYGAIGISRNSSLVSNTVSVTDTEIKTETTFTNWDFIDTWGIDSSTNGGYPYLKNIENYYFEIPTIAIPDQLTGFEGSQLGPSNPLSFTLSATNVTYDMELIASDNFEISTEGTYTNTLTIQPTNGLVNETIYVRLNNTNYGTYSGTLDITSLKSSNSINLNGIVVEYPVITGPSEVGLGDQIRLDASLDPAPSNTWSATSNGYITGYGTYAYSIGTNLGTYTVTYRDVNSRTAEKLITVVQGTTATPTLELIGDTSEISSLTISYTLGENLLADSTKLTFTPVGGGSSIVWTMGNYFSKEFSYTIGTTPSDSPYIRSDTAALNYNSTYSLTLSYQDYYGNPIASSSAVSFTTLSIPLTSISSTTYYSLKNKPLNPIEVTNSGGAASFSISPTLPEGLTIDSTTGTVSGTPTVSQLSTTYKITAQNLAGTDSLTFELFVDEPPQIHTSVISYTENQSTGALLGVVSVTDNIAVQSIEISSGNDIGYFAIDSSTGSLTMTSSGTISMVNDYESGSATTTLEITVTDTYSNTSTSQLDVVVYDLDEIPPVIHTESITYYQSDFYGELIGTISATDNIGVVSYSIVGSSPYFELQERSLLMQTTETAFTSEANDISLGSNTFSLTIQVTDARSNTSTKTIDLYLRSRPVTYNVTATAKENTAQNIQLNATDEDGDNLIYSLVSTPTHGSVTISGSIAIYFSEDDYSTTDSFTYQVFDGFGFSNPSDVTIDIIPVNDPPVLLNLDYTVIEQVEYTSTDIKVYDPDTPTTNLVYSIVSSPTYGSATISGSQFIYTSNSDTATSDVFLLKVSDGELSDTKSVTLTITAVNDPPIPTNIATITYGLVTTTLNLTATDPENDKLTYELYNVPNHGVASVSGTTAYYHPIEGPTGTYSFSYRVIDDKLGISTGTISITVANHDPSTKGYVLEVKPSSTTTFTLSGTDQDQDDATLNFEIKDLPTRGSLTSSGTLATYELAISEVGTYTATYSVRDNLGGEDIGTISITVVNVPPITKVHSITVVEQVTTTIELSGVDHNNDPMSYSMVVTPTYGTATISGSLLTYTSTSDSETKDSLVYIINDGTSNSDSATLSITILPLNDPPEIPPFNLSAVENVLSEMEVYVYDPDSKTSSISISLVSSPTFGTAALSGTTLYYTSNSDTAVEDSFSIKAFDGEIYSDVSTVTIFIGPVNDPPILGNFSIEAREQEEFVSDDIGAIDLDSPNNSLTYSIESLPKNGSATISGSQFIYTSNSDTATSDEFSIKASDGELFSSAASITVKILPVNDDPIVTNISTTTYGLVTTTLTLKATDPEEKELVYVLEALPLHGIATVSGTSAYYYPQIGYSGTYSFTYRVLDGVGGYGIGTISVTVANHLPVVSSTSATIDPTGTVTFSLTATDEDQDDETLIFELENLPSSGSLNINGAIATYQTINAPGGVYSATFRVIDNLGGTVTGTINLIVQNNPPLTNVVSVTALEQIKSTIQLLGEDLENDQLVYSLISSPTYGTATISGSTLLYTSFDEIENNLYETLSYQAYDGSNYSNVSSITITIRPFDDPPILYSFNMNALEQTSSQSEGIYVYDPDSIDHSFIIVDQPSYGSATISSSVILYESNSDIATSDQLSIKAFDGNSFSNVVTVSVSILGVNDKPSASNITISTDEDTSNEIMLLGIDPDGDLLTYTIVTQPKNGSLVLESDKATYTPNMNYYGEDSFRYKASDGTEETQVATVTISVISVNDAPVLSSTTLMVTANVSETLNLEGSDVEGDSLTYSIASNPTHGTASIEGSILTYTPELDYTGSDVLTVKANDGSSDSAPATISITVFLATDGDGDGILDHLDNCPTTSNVDQADGDGDGIGDVCDTNYNPSIRSSSFSIMENASNETLIGTIEIVDTDVSDTHTFSIVENDYVSIDSSTGFLSVKETSLYDYEKTKEFTISVSVSDGTNTATKELTITIDNENEAPGLLTSRSASVNEMATTGTVIKTLSAIDPESDAITYSITEGNPDNIFKIEENRLILASTLDYEIIPLHSLTIKASDGTLESLSSFNVEVIDVPNTSSTESVTITVYDVMVEDNTSRVDYSSMTASGETGLLFEIIGGADAALFTIDPNSGGLIFNTPPDYESPSDADSNNSYDLVIKVTYLNDGSSLIPVVTSSTNFAVPEANALAEDQTEVILVSATQDSDSDGVVDVSDNCPTTYNPNQADWDGDGIGDVCDDSDQDGIADYQDSCVSSVFGATVDLTGCAVFSLPYNNFNVEVTSATCVGTSNGIISIAAHASTYTYTVSISGQSSTTLSSANNYANQISGLEAGTYQVCLGVEGQSGYQQCYTVVIGEPNALSARSSVNYTGRTVDLSLDGSKEYHIKVNGKTFTTSSSELSLDLKAGMNTIEVYTDLTCQGSFFQEVFVSEEVLAYPNPTTDWVQLYVGGVDQTVQLILSDVSGYQYDLRELKIPTNRVIEYNLSDYQTGVYFFRLSGETIQSNLKVIKD